MKRGSASFLVLQKILKTASRSIQSAFTDIIVSYREQYDKHKIIFCGDRVVGILSPSHTTVHAARHRLVQFFISYLFNASAFSNLRLPAFCIIYVSATLLIDSEQSIFFVCDIEPFGPSRKKFFCRGLLAGKDKKIRCL